MALTGTGADELGAHELGPMTKGSSLAMVKVGLGTDKPKSTGVGVGSKFFKK